MNSTARLNRLCQHLIPQQQQQQATAAGVSAATHIFPFGASSPTHAVKTMMPKAVEMLNDERPCAFFYDLDMFQSTVEGIAASFPSTTLHAIAMKTNPLAATLCLARDKAGFGVEVASPAELEHALRMGFLPQSIVFDSPAKTYRDLRRAMHAGVRINCDNFQELERIDEILAADFSGGKTAGVGKCLSKFGLRVNPQLGGGAIAETGTVAKTSKFGVPLIEVKEYLIQFYVEHSWLTALHCHVGSQGMPLSFLVNGAKSICELANTINKKAGSNQVTTLDIGGGLPVNYTNDDGSTTNVSGVAARGIGVSHTKYVAALKESVPELFTPKWELVTEFGRYVNAKAGVGVSRCEYVKEAGGRGLIIQHLGADVLLRSCYRPQAWPHRVSLWDKNANYKPSSEAVSTRVYDVVGPLCFSGDIIAPGVSLSTDVGPGDYVVVHDAGAYTRAMFSKYNSRQAPPVYGYRLVDGQATMSLIAKGESLDEALQMWQQPS